MLELISWYSHPLGDSLAWKQWTVMMSPQIQCVPTWTLCIFFALTDGTSFSILSQLCKLETWENPGHIHFFIWDIDLISKASYLHHPNVCLLHSCSPHHLSRGPLKGTPKWPPGFWSLCCHCLVFLSECYWQGGKYIIALKNHSVVPYCLCFGDQIFLANDQCTEGSIGLHFVLKGQFQFHISSKFFTFS